MHFRNILQHVPEKILVCVKITYEKKTNNPRKKSKRHEKEFQKGGNMNDD